MQSAQPVLWREPGVLQIGLDPGASLLLTDCPPEADRSLRLLLAGRTASQVAALSPSVDPDWIAASAQLLLAAGLLIRREASEGTVVLLGSGALADACTHLLTRIGARVERPSVAQDWSAPTRRDRIALMASDRVEPDRGLLSVLTRAQVPHLIVRAEPGRTVVGPFVHVGRGPCQHCLDLVRRDLDGRWPHLLAQLCRTVTEPDAVHRTWAAATAVTQVRAWWSGTLPETIGTTLELPDDHRLSARRWPMHPSCPCREAGARAA